MNAAASPTSGAADAAAKLIQDIEALRRTQPEAAWETLARDFGAALRGASPARRGELWRLRGHVLRSLRRLAPAAQAYRRAEGWYRRAGDAREVGRCAIGLVDALMYLGRYREAERVASRGRRALEGAGDLAAQARLLNNEGNLYHRTDRPGRALERYRRARRALTRARDVRGRALVDGNIANCLSLLGRLPEARRLYHASRRVSQKRGFALDALNAEYNLAYLDFLEHRHERALEALERVGDAARSAGVPALEALSALDRSEILLRLGAHGDALGEATHGAEAFKRLGMTYERAKAETFVALAEFRLGRRGAARARLERTLEAFAAEGNAVWVGEALVGLATLWWAEGIPAASAPLLAAAARRFSWAADREREGSALALLARVQLERGRRSAAAANLARARRLAAPGGSPRLRHLVWIAAADQARRRGNLRAARQHLRRAARESERLAARILDEQWRASFWGDWGWPHQDLAALEMDEGRIEEAFEALERGRGRVLASSWRGARRRAVPAEVRAWAASRLARDLDRSTRSGALQSPPAQRPAPASPGLRRLLRRPVAPDSIRAAALRARLPADALLLDYSLHRGTLSAFVATRERLRLASGLVREGELFALCHDALFELRRAALEPPSSRSLQPALTQALAGLASVVLWPVIGAAGVPRTLAVLPVGPLARLPWAALPLPDGRLLGEASRLVVVPGLRLALAARAPRPPRGSGLIVASSLGELENVAPEAGAVGRALPGAVRLADAEATAERFLAHAAGAPWIHFAGHGLYQAGRSGLRFHDRWLLAEELEGLRLSARWVALSACQSARALVQPGEEWFGLARAMLIAGAQAVLAAQWDVEDAAAARFMTGVYDRLSAGADLGDAVSGTQAELTRGARHPLEWAGFVILGGPAAVEVGHETS